MSSITELNRAIGWQYFRAGLVESREAFSIVHWGSITGAFARLLVKVQVL